ncbi:MAG: UvrD-helicase domain-containing protein [Micrococcales bacterium]|nr:UvrD-helicase domain-containing protein [Micrococcales bacterium]
MRTVSTDPTPTRAQTGDPAATEHAIRTFDIADPLPTGTVLLEASAGTGKTWTIAALVTRHVAEGVATLPQMLVVTFGRAASQELRARVREQLVRAERALARALAQTEAKTEAVAEAATEAEAESEAEAEPDGLLRLLLAADDDERAARLRRIRLALASFDSATIATTHQFCREVLRNLGVAGNTDAGAHLVESLDGLLVEIVDDLYLRGFVGDSEQPIFTRRQALAIARRAVDDVHARLRPRDAPPGSEAARRVAFAHAVRREFEARERRLQVMQYNDLLTQLADALEKEDSPARTRMRRRWRVVLVDEFQDTDPIQWQVLERAFAGHARALVLIGDPKQAIYAFRGGDVVTYLAAAASADDRATLTRNFRTDAPLVDALQVLLQGAALGDEQIIVHPVVADRSTGRLVGAPHSEALRLRQVLRSEHLHGDTKMSAVRPYIARDLALDVAQLLASGATFDERPLRAKDIAVIAGTSRTLLQVQQALREVGIHAVSTGGSNVLASRAAHEWLAVLEAMAAPHRSGLTRAAALTDLLGYSPADLDNMGGPGGVGCADPAGCHVLDDVLADRLRRLASLCAEHGAAAVLEAVTISGLPARLLARVGGERELTDVRHVGQLLHEASREGRLGLLGLLDWLRAQMVEDMPQSAGARTRRLDSDAAAVQLATIHGSKGLQYPVVYLPSLTERWVNEQPQIPLFHEDPPLRTRCLDVGGASSPDRGLTVSRHLAEEAGESLRHLYVAMTRAQSQVVTWWAPTSNTKSAPLHRMLFGRTPPPSITDGEAGIDGVTATVPDTEFVTRKDAEATARLAAWARLGAFHLERADHAPPVPDPTATPAPALALRTFDRRIDTQWRRTSYSALSTPRGSHGDLASHVFAGVNVEFGGVGSEPEVTPRDDEGDPRKVIDDIPTLPGLALAGADVPSPMADLPVGATFGSLVHAVLEHADPAAPELRDELLTHVREQLDRWPVDLDPAALADALVEVCDTPLGALASGVTLRAIGRADRLCEMSFELPLGGGDARAAHGYALLGDLAPLLRRHLKVGDPVRAYADVLQAQPQLAEQQLRGYLTGSVDLVLRVGDRYLVVDYKTNWLGPLDEPLTASAYRREALIEAMGTSSYPLQALLYAVVAHRFLRWRLPDYDPDRHLGGILYLYVRGMCGAATPIVDGAPCGVFAWRPPVRLVVAVSDLLNGTGPDARIRAGSGTNGDH